MDITYLGEARMVEINPMDVIAHGLMHHRVDQDILRKPEIRIQNCSTEYALRLVVASAAWSQFDSKSAVSYPGAAVVTALSHPIGVLVQGLGLERHLQQGRQGIHRDARHRGKLIQQHR